eukprot:TRINITY_DN37009_c0_g1_i1.p1 TRINITY_DN37009_c0_g1~~TRINITY_DN37009_c0_g1_i1.p1  ORF type:complete len:275 (+),score=81.12 TRINITY_DN37009_c0_g1_i1:253-1077(+)
MKVVLAARRIDKLEANVAEIEAHGGSAMAVRCDVTNPVSVEWAFDQAERAYGGLDFVFVNAGWEGNLLRCGHAEVPSSTLQQICDVNVVGAMETLRRAVIAFRKRGGGTIAFSSSIAALDSGASQAAMNALGVPAGSSIAYSATKAAVDMIASSAAGSYAEEGINVYNFNIGVFKTDMAGRLGLEEDASYNPIFKESGGDTKHIAEVALAILDGSSLWPPGSSIIIDNDATIHAKYFYDTLRDPAGPEYFGWRSPDELKAVACDVKGAPYIWNK